MEKTAVAFLTDYRSGAIGRISLETPLSRSEMMQASLPNVVEDTAPEVNEDEAS
jgi:ribosome biogenesis GTPase A